jgi:hypothetical protein
MGWMTNNKGGFVGATISLIPIFIMIGFYYIFVGWWYKPKNRQ